jgi:hypothetical protein
MSDDSRSFHAYFIKLIINISDFCCFPPYATTSSITLANMHALFPLGDPTSCNILAAKKIAATSFFL